MPGLWSVIVPEAGTNYITNPSLETNSTGWSAYNGGTFTRSTFAARYGIWSALATVGGVNQGIQYQQMWTAANGTYYFSFAGLPLVGANQSLSVEVLDGGASRGVVELDLGLLEKWKRLNYGTATLTNAALVVVRFYAKTAGTNFAIDGLQAE